MNSGKHLQKSIIFEYIPMTLAAIGILISAIAFDQLFIKVLPMFVTLFLMILIARANRVGFLLGSFNGVIYIIGYAMEGVYGTALSTAFAACLMLITYFRWKKKARGQATVFSSFKNKERIILALAILILWGVSSFVLWKVNGTAVVFDGLVLVIGLVVPILNVRAYIESPVLNIISLVVNTAMWIEIVVINGRLSSITYLILSLYNLYAVIRTFIKWRELYKEQKSNDDFITTQNT